MLKNLYALFVIASTTLFSISPDLMSLPWVNGNDDDSALYATPFLPDDPIIFEAGTCSGSDTIKFKKIWKDSTIFGFEPVPRSYYIAKKKTRLLTGVKLFKLALFENIGKQTFYLSKENAGASSILKDNFGSVTYPDGMDNEGEPKTGIYKDTPITVSTTTINSFAKEHDVSYIDYIWLDTEGAELPILSAATDYLENVRVITVEINFQEFRKNMTTFSDLHTFLTEKNFTMKYIWSNWKDQWQANAMYINNRILDESLNLSNEYIIPELIDKDNL